MWGVLLEKAFAKIYGNYGHLRAGDPRDAARALSGAPSVMLMHHKAQVTLEKVWQ